MRTEIDLLRKIADAIKDVWDNGRLSLEDAHLKNLLTDSIDLRERADQPLEKPLETPSET